MKSSASETKPLQNPLQSRNSRPSQAKRTAEPFQFEIIIIILSMPKWHMRPPFKVSVTIIVLQGRVASPAPNPQPGGPGYYFCLVPLPQTNPAWLTLPGAQGSRQHSSWSRKGTQASPPHQGTAPGEIEIAVLNCFRRRSFHEPILI